MLHADQIAPGLVNADDHIWSEHPFATIYSGTLGVCSSKLVWFWFRLDFDGTLMFDHAYSQINGSTSRSSSARNRAERLLCRLAGLDDCARGDESYLPDHKYRRSGDTPTFD